MAYALQMNLILEAVQTTYRLQIEVQASLDTMTV
jgi:hypothetical protein